MFDLFRERMCGSDMPKISVIMPVYNAERYLDRALDSVLEQTLEDFEFICVNDGSTDASADILRERQMQDKRIQVYEQSNQGAGIARNMGLGHAKGEYLLFLDSDDIFHPDMFRQMYNRCVQENLDVVVCRSNRFELGREGARLPIPYALQKKLLPKKQPFRALDVQRDFFNAFVWWPWDKMFRRNFICRERLSFQGLRTTNDLYFVVTAMLLAKRISYIDEVLVSHQICNTDSLEGSREKSSKCFYEALLKVQEFLLTKGFYQHFQQDFINYCLSFSLWQVDTLHGEKHKELLNFMVRVGWPNLGVDQPRRDYFYKQADYENFCRKMGRENKKDLPCLLIYGLGAHFSDMLEWHPELAKMVTRVFDKDKQKIGLTLYSPRVTIESPEALRNLPQGTEILISAIRHLSEIKREIHRLNPGLLCKDIDLAYQEIVDRRGGQSSSRSLLRLRWLFQMLSYLLPRL